MPSSHLVSLLHLQRKCPAFNTIQEGKLTSPFSISEEMLSFYIFFAFWNLVFLIPRHLRISLTHCPSSITTLCLLLYFYNCLNRRLQFVTHTFVCLNDNYIFLFVTVNGQSFSFCFTTLFKISHSFSSESTSKTMFQLCI